MPIEDNKFLNALSGGLGEQAILLFEKRLANDPNDVVARRRIAEMYRSSGQLKQAAQHYRVLSGYDGYSAYLSVANMLAGQPFNVDEVLSVGLEPFCLERNLLSEPMKSTMLTLIGRDTMAIGRVGLGRKASTVRDALQYDFPKDRRNQICRDIEPVSKGLASKLAISDFAANKASAVLLAYPHLGGYRAHRDWSVDPESPHHRRILTLVTYLNDDRSLYEGGEFLLYDHEGSGFTKFVPEADMTIAIRAQALHEVAAVRRFDEDPQALCRSVFVLWFKRPKSEEEERRDSCQSSSPDSVDVN